MVPSDLTPAGTPPMFTLGLNTFFTATRWPRPEEKFRIARELGVGTVQYSLDGFSPCWPASWRRGLARSIRRASEKHGVGIHSTFTGAGHHFDSFLLHPEREWREHSLRWFEAAIRFSAEIGSQGAGGFMGALSLPDVASPRIVRARINGYIEALLRLTSVARECGQQFFMIEPMSVRREPPSTIAESVDLMERLNRHAEIPVRLCLDVGHIRAVTAPTAEDRNPCAWLRRCGRYAEAVHVHQTDAAASRHWPFTPQNNRKGIIDGRKVLCAIAASGTTKTTLIIEVFFAPYEPMDERVLPDLHASVMYWKNCLCSTAPASD